MNESIDVGFSKKNTSMFEVKYLKILCVRLKNSIINTCIDERRYFYLELYEIQ